MGRIVLWIGIIVIICSIIFSFLVGNQYDEFEISTILPWLVGGVISGILIIAFAEVIFILDEIKNRINLTK
ncbi:hypothetical protein D3C74_425940 [compost metagenome]